MRLGRQLAALAALAALSALPVTAQSLPAPGVPLAWRFGPAPGLAGLAVDARGNVFAADPEQGEVLEFPRRGPLDFDPAIALGSGFVAPSGLAVAADGTLYVADAALGQVFALAPGASSPAVVAGLSLVQPEGLALDRVGDLFVADRGLNQVLELPAGADAPLAWGSGWIHPQALALGPANDLFVGEADGSEIVHLRSPDATPEVLPTPYAADALALDANGHLWLVHRGGRGLEEWSAPGSVIQEDNLAPERNTRAGVAIDAGGNVFYTGPGAVVELAAPSG